MRWPLDAADYAADVTELRAADAQVEAPVAETLLPAVGDTQQRAVVHALETLGWSLLSAELDLCAGTARIELRQGDRLVTLDARNGRATITRERSTVETVVVGRRGDRCRVDRLRTEFLGRTRHEGIRCALRSLSNYIEDNASMPRFAARPAFALLLSGATVKPSVQAAERAAASMAGAVERLLEGEVVA